MKYIDERGAAWFNVKETILKNKQEQTVNKENIAELIRICFNFSPNEEAMILDMVEKHFPQFIEEINKYRILL
jgi:hypothetical protein